MNSFFGGMLIAKSENNVLTYLHTDHLGSVVLETDTVATLSMTNAHPRPE